jgi:hypothetical protein
MNTAHLGRRLGDWLGIVPEDDVPVATAPDYFDLDQLERRPAPRPVEQLTVDAVSVVNSPPSSSRLAPVTPEPPAPSPVRSGGPNAEPAKNVRSFRDVVNQRRAETQRRAANPQAPPRW